MGVIALEKSCVGFGLHDHSRFTRCEPRKSPRRDVDLPLLGGSGANQKTVGLGHGPGAALGHSNPEDDGLKSGAGNWTCNLDIAPILANRQDSVDSVGLNSSRSEQMRTCRRHPSQRDDSGQSSSQE